MSTADILAVSLRALAFIASFQAAGSAVFLALFTEQLRTSAALIARLTARTAVLGLVLTAAAQLAAPARLVGTLGGILDGSMQLIMLESDAGTASAMRLLGLALVASGASARAPRFSAAIGLVGATLVASSFAFMGHTVTIEHRWLAVGLLFVHLMLVAFWFGALQPLRLVSRHEEHAASGLVVARFSMLAGRLVPWVLLAGLGLAWLLLPSAAALLSPYGVSLLAKAAGFALLMALAALNKWRYVPQIGSGDRRAVAALRLSVAVEWWLIAGVLTLTAAMTAFFSPAH